MMGPGITLNAQFVIDSIIDREEACWIMARVFLENHDAHGLHDMGVEIQALQRAIMEIRKLEEIMAKGKDRPAKEKRKPKQDKTKKQSKPKSAYKERNS